MNADRDCMWFPVDARSAVRALPRRTFLPANYFFAVLRGHDINRAYSACSCTASG